MDDPVCISGNDTTCLFCVLIRTRVRACLTVRTYHEGVEERRATTPVLEKRSVPGSGNGNGDGHGRREEGVVASERAGRRREREREKRTLDEILGWDPGEKETDDLQKHPVAPCTKGEMREFGDGKGNAEVVRPIEGAWDRETKRRRRGREAEVQRRRGRKGAGKESERGTSPMKGKDEDRRKSQWPAKVCCPFVTRERVVTPAVGTRNCVVGFSTENEICVRCPVPLPYSTRTASRRIVSAALFSRRAVRDALVSSRGRDTSEDVNERRSPSCCYLALRSWGQPPCAYMHMENNRATSTIRMHNTNQLRQDNYGSTTTRFATCSPIHKEKKKKRKKSMIVALLARTLPIFTKNAALPANKSAFNVVARRTRRVLAGSTKGTIALCVSMPPTPLLLHGCPPPPPRGGWQRRRAPSPPS
ncbi:hypothetical protein ALC60_08794 [Trachymyrmex zeteki]|uniref:Uncharacterized protein n=1 Tax=Mycetomoellerius zeteki TaxID=64791 RepID=A0A151WW64_9HYME|nr:hypothetical protein ALC60_08794 [Trachymyrmex zeteki]